MSALNLITLKSFGVTPVIKKEAPKSEPTYEKNYEISINEDNIVGIYNDDLNLIELNGCILQMLDTIKELEINKYTKIQTAERYNISKIQSKCERESSLKLLKHATENLNNYAKDLYKKQYIKDIESILNGYTQIGPIKKYITFGKSTTFKNNEESTDKKLHRFSLIEDFLTIASRYVKINISKRINFKGCTVCGADLKNIQCSDNDNFVCGNCNAETIQLVKFKPSVDNTIKKTSVLYKGKINFTKELSRYQGKLKNIKIPQDLVPLLDEYFEQVNFPIGSEVRNNAGLVARTNKDLMYNALKKLGLSNLYKDIHLVCNIYWGWELINLDHLETKILEKYDTINEVFESLKNERFSALNTQYELWWILTMLDHSCSASDFKIPKTPEIFEYHEKKREEICDKLGWKFIPLNINSL